MNFLSNAKIIRTKRRSLALIVTQDATLTVRAPHNTPLETIHDFIRSKSHWISAKIDEARRRPLAPTRQFQTGESFLYLGRPYPLRVVSAGSRSLKFDAGFVLSAATPRPREAFMKWYKAQASRIISERVRFYALGHAFSYKSVRITSALKRWGSCSASGRLNFSWRLVLTPVSVIDSVVVHELAHLRHKDHSRAFWTSVLAIMPDYKKRSQYLKENDSVIKI